MIIGIYIYDDAEVLDFSGPFEVFSTAARVGGKDWSPVLISESGSQVNARGGFQVLPNYSISNHPDLDVVLVAGGVHTREVEKEAVIQWIASMAESSMITASVCTGCFFLARTGLLDGLSVTTHWEDIPDLRSRHPELTVLEDRRWVQSGKYVTSGGISAGIDMSLFLVSELASEELAQKTARQMEYRWQTDPE